MIINQAFKSLRSRRRTRLIFSRPNSPRLTRICDPSKNKHNFNKRHRWPHGIRLLKYCHFMFARLSCHDYWTTKSIVKKILTAQVPVLKVYTHLTAKRWQSWPVLIGKDSTAKIRLVERLAAYLVCRRHSHLMILLGAGTRTHATPTHRLKTALRLKITDATLENFCGFWTSRDASWHHATVAHCVARMRMARMLWSLFGKIIQFTPADDSRATPCGSKPLIQNPRRIRHCCPASNSAVKYPLHG